MANVKISQLPAASTPLAGTEEIPLVQGGITKQVTVDGLLTSANLGTPSVINLTYATNVPVNEATGVLPVANGGTGAATAAAGIENLLPAYSGNASKRLSLNSGATALEWVSDGGGTVTSVGMSVPSFLSVSGSPVTSSGTLALSYSGTALPVANGGTGTTTSTGTGSVVLSSSPTLVTPALGTPSAAILTNATGSPISTGVSGLGTGVATFLATPSSANLAAAVSDETGSGALVFATSPTLVTPALGTPTSGNFSTGTFTWPTFNQNTTGTAANITATSNSTLTTLSALSLPGSQVSGNISGNAANVTGVVAVANGGTGTSTPSLVQGSNITITGTWPNQTIAATAGSSGTVTSVSGTGTVSGITLTGTVTTSGSLTLGGTLDLSAYNGAGAFTTLSASSTVTLSGGTANGVTYLNGSKVLTSGSALTFDGTQTFKIRQNTNGIGNYSELLLDVANSFSGTGQSYLRNISLNAGNSSTALAFGVNADGGGSPAEGMRLTSTGLGIGRSLPSYKLDVLNSGTTWARLGNGGSNSGAGLILADASTSKNWVISNEYNISGALEFTQTTAAGGSTIGSSAALTLSSSGNLGLGVTPSAWSFKALQIGGSYGFLNFSSTGGGGAVITNAYFDGTNYKYQNTNYAGLFDFGLSTAGAFSWRQAASGTAGNTATFSTLMTLDASGRLVVGATSTPVQFSVQNSSTSLGVEVDTASGFNTGPTIRGYYRSGSAYTTLGLTGSQVMFGINDVEKARIDSSGNLLVGTTTNTPAQSNVSGFKVGSGQIECNGTNTQAAFFGRSNDGQVVRFYNAGSAAGNISNTGTTTSYNGTSDYRLKDNIQPMVGALEKVAQLKPCTYIWKADGRLGQGFIAHELQEVIPDAVQGTKDEVDENGIPEYQGIDPRMVVATLTAAIQEQQAIIESLKARLDAANI